MRYAPENLLMRWGATMGPNDKQVNVMGILFFGLLLSGILFVAIVKLLIIAIPNEQFIFEFIPSLIKYISIFVIFYLFASLYSKFTK